MNDRSGTWFALMFCNEIIRLAVLILISIPCAILCGWPTLHADRPTVEAKTVAGRSIQQYADQISDSDRVVRLRAIRSLGAFGESAGPELRIGLDHQDRAVRYVAAVQLGRIGGQALADAKPALQRLADDPSSLAVRIASSFALCRAGQISDHLPLLIESLEHPERGIACSAAELIGRIGPEAAPATKALETALKNNQPGTRRGDPHIGGAAQNALRKIRGAKEKR